ncbi:biotin/lipoyl-binding protein, partial [Nocardioides guangzhouensis]
LAGARSSTTEGGDPGPVGHAIEVRLYAEDPAHDWQPQSGLLTALDVPGVDVELQPGRGLRLDAGFETGSEVSTHYDAMLAKVVAWAPTRHEAARRLAAALAKARLHGLVTNRDLLVRILRDQRFLDGGVSTDFLASFVLDGARLDVHHEAVAAAIALAEHRRSRRAVQSGIPVAWRNVVSQPQRARFAHGAAEVEVDWYGGRDGYAVDGLTVLAAGPDRVTLEVGGISATYAVAVHGRAVDVDGPLGHVRLDLVPRFTDPSEQVAAGSLLAPMPGTVVSVAVAAGDAVRAGQPVLVLEAMKMQHTITAPADGVVTEIPVDAGAQVAAGAVLAVVDPEAVPQTDAGGDQT